MKPHALFVTGTGTGVGKSVVSASLVRALRLRGIDAIGIKPFATGVNHDSNWLDDDAKLLAAASDVDDIRRISPLRFKEPLAPYTAAQLENKVIDVRGVVEQLSESATWPPIKIIEGVGGVAVPLTADVLVSDFAKMLEIPVLIVSRTDLGTINHTLLTVEQLRNRGCSLHGVIFVRHSSESESLAEKTGPGAAAQLAAITSFGVVPHCLGLHACPTASEAVAVLPVECDAIQRLADSLIG